MSRSKWKVSEILKNIVLNYIYFRRVRDVKEEERQQKWVAKTEDREKEAKRKKYVDLF